mgnify:CR=1 FL=1
MQRSLFSGVTGMTNHQLILDNTANNLANVSTAGFKATRVNFATALNQTRSSGVGPGNGLGGINPQQIGLGVSTSSLDVEMKQGALLATGRTLDVAIQGEGFFQLRQTEEDSTNALREFYSRVGNFGFDKTDDLVDLGSGLKVVGLDTGSGAVSAPTVINIAKYRSIAATPTGLPFTWTSADDTRLPRSRITGRAACSAVSSIDRRYLAPPEKHSKPSFFDQSPAGNRPGPQSKRIGSGNAAPP